MNQLKDFGGFRAFGEGDRIAELQTALACLGAEVVFASANWSRAQLALDCPTDVS
jgi:hypothetical protein